MKLLNKIKFTIFFNSMYTLGVVMFRLILMIVAVVVVYHVFNDGLSIKVNDKAYQFQVETKGNK